MNANIAFGRKIKKKWIFTSDFTSSFVGPYMLKRTIDNAKVVGSKHIKGEIVTQIQEISFCFNLIKNHFIPCLFTSPIYIYSI